MIGKTREELDGDRLILDLARVLRGLMVAGTPASGETASEGTNILTSRATASGAFPDTPVSDHAPMPSISPDAYYTPEQVAAYFQMAPKTLASWRSSGGGPAFHKIGRILYRGEDLLAWSASRRAASTAAVKEKKRASAA